MGRGLVPRVVFVRVVDHVADVGNMIAARRSAFVRCGSTPTTVFKSVVGRDLLSSRRMAQELYEVVDDYIIAAIEALGTGDVEARRAMESDQAENIAHSHIKAAVTAASAQAPTLCAVDGEPQPCLVIKTLAFRYGVKFHDQG